MENYYNHKEDDQSNSKFSGRWTIKEHQKFIEALQIYGKNWKKVEEFVGTRNGAQIRSHAQKFFNRLEKESLNGDCNLERDIARKFIGQSEGTSKKPTKESSNKENKENKENIDPISQENLMANSKRKG